MKNKLTVFSIVIVCALIVSVFSPAAAKPLPPKTEIPDPVVTWLAGDKEFTSSLLPTVQLPGNSGEDAYLPLGDWPEGEKLFGDKGVAISGFSYGSVSICFPFITTNAGWSYAAAVFDGSKWKTLPTSITSNEETPYSWACTTVFANGTYGLLKWWGDNSQPLEDCGFEVGLIGLNGYGTNEDENYFYAVITELGFHSSRDLSGKQVTITFTGAMKSKPVSGFLSNYGPGLFIFERDIPVRISKNGNPNNMNLILKFSTCEVEVSLNLQ